MSRVVAKYLLTDGPMMPVGTILTVGLDVDLAMAVWVEHEFPVDTDNLMTLWTTPTDAEIDRVGTWVGTIASLDLHVYTSGPVNP
jgi:hypothetical protein